MLGSVWHALAWMCVAAACSRRSASSCSSSKSLTLEAADNGSKGAGDSAWGAGNGGDDGTKLETCDAGTGAAASGAAAAGRAAPETAPAAGGAAPETAAAGGAAPETASRIPLAAPATPSATSVPAPAVARLAGGAGGPNSDTGGPAFELGAIATRETTPATSPAAACGRGVPRGKLGAGVVGAGASLVRRVRWQGHGRRSNSILAQA